MVCSHGCWTAAAQRSVTKLKSSVNAMNSIASINALAVQCRQSSVSVRARAVALLTRMMFNARSPRIGSTKSTVMPRPNPLTPLNRIVDADAQLKSWNERRLREEALLRSVRRALPRPVAERVHLAEEQSGRLEVATSAGAIASVVRQHGPTILAALRREGWQFSGIAVRVQPRSMPLSLAKSLPRQWDSANRQAMDGLCARLPPGPLKTALLRFLRTR